MKKEELEAAAAEAGLPVEQVQRVVEFAQKLGELTIAEERMFKRETGFDVDDVMENLGNVEVRAMLVYIYKKRAGEATFKKEDVDNMSRNEVLEALGLQEPTEK